MPEPSTTEGRRIQGELKDLLEGATVRRAESSASRRRADPSEHHTASSRRMREASVHPERTRDEAPAARDRLGDEQHRRDPRARLEEKVRRGYHPRRGDAAKVRRIRVPRSSHPVHESSAGHTASAVPRPVPSPDYHHQVLEGDESGVVARGLPAGMPVGRGGRRQPHHPQPPLFLSDAVWAWLEHVPPAQISDWDDLVKAFAGNFQGTYVRPGNSWDL
jgi:hypothetical protein